MIFIPSFVRIPSVAKSFPHARFTIVSPRAIHHQLSMPHPYAKEHLEPEGHRFGPKSPDRAWRHGGGVHESYRALRKAVPDAAETMNSPRSMWRQICSGYLHWTATLKRSTRRRALVLNLAASRYMKGREKAHSSAWRSGSWLDRKPVGVPD